MLRSECGLPSRNLPEMGLAENGFQNSAHLCTALQGSGPSRATVTLSQCVRCRKTWLRRQGLEKSSSRSLESPWIYAVQQVKG